MDKHYWLHFRFKYTQPIWSGDENTHIIQYPFWCQQRVIYIAAELPSLFDVLHNTYDVTWSSRMRNDYSCYQNNNEKSKFKWKSVATFDVA